MTPINCSSVVTLSIIISGCQTLDRLENNSRTVKGAQMICQDNEALAHVLQPLKGWSKGCQNPCK